MEEKKIPLIIDTDPGIDDAASIFWVLASGKFDVKALTVTHGNVGVDSCTKNALRLLQAAGRPDIPVYKGSPRPLIRPRISAEFAHGNDGMGNTDMPAPTIEAAEGHAANRIVEIARASQRPVTILAIGPITNVALAILLEPELKRYVEKIIFMGGAVHVAGNMTPVASFNVVADPEAAQIVYRSGIPVVQIGLDICNQFSFYPQDFEQLRKTGTPITSFIWQMVQFRLAQIGGENARAIESVARLESIALNDVAATSYLMNPDWFQTEMVVGDVETAGRCAGMTVLDFANRENREPNVCFAYGVDSKAAIAQWSADLCAAK